MVLKTNACLSVEFLDVFNFSCCITFFVIFAAWFTLLHHLCLHVRLLFASIKINQSINQPICTQSAVIDIVLIQFHHHHHLFAQNSYSKQLTIIMQ